MSRKGFARLKTERRLAALTRHSTAASAGAGSAFARDDYDPPAYKALRPLGLVPANLNAWAGDEGVVPRASTTLAELASKAKAASREHPVPVGSSPPFKMSQDRVDAFAALTIDNNFIHLHDAAERGSPFGGPICHGFLTLSMLSYLTAQATPKISGVQMGVNYGLNKVRFLAPVPVGSEIVCRASVVEVGPPQPAGKGTSRVKIVWDLRIETLAKGKAPKLALVCEWVTMVWLADGAAK